MKTKSILLGIVYVVGTTLLTVSHSIAQTPTIFVTGSPPWTEFTVTNSNKIIFEFQTDPAAGDTTINMTVPATGATIQFEKDGSPCDLSASTICNGSDISVPAAFPGQIQIVEIGGATTPSTFKVKGVSLSDGTWVARVPQVPIDPIDGHASILSVQAKPKIAVIFPAEIASGQVSVSLDASSSQSVYEPAASAPAITSYSWVQILGPSVTSTTNPSGDVLTLDAPTVSSDTDLEFQVTASDSQLEASQIITVTVLPPDKPIDAVLAIDTSGSMGWHRTGSANDLVGGCCSRLASAKLAAKYFIGRLGTFATDSRVGVAIFPGEPAPSTVLGKPWTPATGLTTLATASDINNIQNDIGGESITCGDCLSIPASPGMPTGIPVNWNGTPTRDGLNAAKNMLTTAPGSSSTSKSRIIVLLSDGAWNIGLNPAEPAYLAGFVADGIHIYTIGMGSGIDNVNHSSLQDISVNTGVGTAANPIGFTSYNVGDAASEPNLIPHFEKILSDLISLDFASDPPASIRPGQQKIHKTWITSHDSIVNFTLSWESSRSNLLDFYVLTPNGLRITPTITGNGFKNITVGKRILNVADNIGEWSIVVNYPSNESQRGTISYNYSVFMKSSLNMRTLFNKDKYSTGDEMLLQVRLIEDNRYLKGALVSAVVSRPGESIGNWQASHSVSADEVIKLPAELSGETLTLIDRKNYLLLYKKKVKLPEIIKLPKIILNDEGRNGDKYPHDGIYTALFRGLDVPGVFRFHISATGTTLNGQKFVREAEVQKFVDLSFDPVTMLEGIEFMEIKISPFFPPALKKILQEPAKKGFKRQSVVFTPQDRYGNKWGPGYANEITFALWDAEPLSPVFDNLDGTYVKVIQFEKAANPTVTVAARGITSEKKSIRGERDFPSCFLNVLKGSGN